MPYTIRHNGPSDKPWCVYHKGTNDNKGCSVSKAKAYAHMRAMYAAEHTKAQEESLQERLCKIRDAFDKVTRPQPLVAAPDAYVPSTMYTVDIFDTYLIAKCAVSDTYWKIKFSEDAQGEVQIQDEEKWQEVEQQYVPVKDSTYATKETSEAGVGTEVEVETKATARTTEDYVRVRVKQPSAFEEGSFRTITIDAKKGVKAVIGRLKGETSTTVQAYLFEKDKWDEGKAKAWVTAHGKKKETDEEPTVRGAIKALWNWISKDNSGDPEDFSAEVEVPVGTFFTKEQPDGQQRWVSISSTAFLDGQQEIVSREGVDSGIARAKASTRDKGPLLFWHTKSIPLGTCDFQVRDDACLIESGLWDGTPEAQAAQKSVATNPAAWGVSIGFLGFKSKPAVINGANVSAVWTDLQFDERSILPATRAATKFSLVQTKSDGGEAMLADREKALKDLLGEDLAKQVVAKVDGVNKAAEATTAVVKEAPAPTPASQVSAGNTLDAAVEALVRTVAPTLAPATTKADAKPGVCVCPDCGKTAKQVDGKACSTQRCSACDVAMKDKAAKADEGSSAVLEILKELQASIAGLQTEIKAIKDGEAPRIAQAGTLVAPATSGTEGTKADEVPKVVRDIAATMFRTQPQA